MKARAAVCARCGVDVPDLDGHEFAVYGPAIVRFCDNHCPGEFDGSECERCIEMWGECAESPHGDVHCWHESASQHMVPYHRCQNCCWCGRGRCLRFPHDDDWEPTTDEELRKEALGEHGPYMASLFEGPS